VSEMYASLSPTFAWLILELCFSSKSEGVDDGPVVTWSNYVIKDWGQGQCSKGTRVDDFAACAEAFKLYTDVCRTRDNGPQYETWSGQPGCHMQNAGFAEFQYNANLEEASTPQHAPICKVQETQAVECYDETKLDVAPPPPLIQEHGNRHHHSHRHGRGHHGPSVTWGHYIIQDWGEGTCSEGTRVDDYNACISAFKDYKSMCDTADDRPQYETWHGQPGCHMQNAGFAEFQYNSNLAEVATPGHAPVCWVGRPQPLRCYKEHAHHVFRIFFIGLLVAIPCIVGWSVYACYRCKCCCWQAKAMPPARTIQYNPVVMGQAVAVAGEEVSEGKRP